MNFAVFLDRDGVLNQDPPHYAHRLDQLALIPRSDDAVKLLKDMGYLVIVISNQSGIARGYYSEEAVFTFNNALLAEIQKKGGDIDAMYYCPHHPESKNKKYNIHCDCRKPKPGMILTAAKKFSINLKGSFVIGDKMSDIDAGINAGCDTILVLTGHGAGESANMKDKKCLIAADLYEAVTRYIPKITPDIKKGFN